MPSFLAQGLLRLRHLAQRRSACLFVAISKNCGGRKTATRTSGGPSTVFAMATQSTAEFPNHVVGTDDKWFAFVIICDIVP
jgi:hypothetical protein